MDFFKRTLRALGLCGALGYAFLVSGGESDATWQKITTEDQPLRDAQMILTPSLFDHTAVTTVSFPADGSPVELKLPHEGAGTDGKPRPALQGAMRQRAIWLDLDGDGKPSSKEMCAILPTGEAGPFAYTANYADGTSGLYVFKLQATKTAGEFRIVRLCAKVARIGKKNTMVLIDDDGNGLYNDVGRDVICVDQQPVTFLGRQVYIDDQLYELLVHPGGNTIEIRPMAHYQTGRVNLFKEYTYPQKAENLRIHTVIALGTESSFGFTPQQPVRDLPVGSYDLVFALFERSTERVYMLKGTTTSFSVEANKEASVKWGGQIDAQFKIEVDGRSVTVSPPTFVGHTAGEPYFPSDLQKIPFSATMAQYLRDRRGNLTDHAEGISTLKFQFDPNGALKPVVFECTRNDELLISVDYKSGILGPVHGEKRHTFVFRRGK